MQEINDLHVEGLPKVEKLNALVGGRYVNLAYPLPSGAAVIFFERPDDLSGHPAGIGVRR